MLERRVRKHHHVRAILGRKLEPARQVRVEHVETAGAKVELARLEVDEHLVLELDGPRHRGIGDAGNAIHLEMDELVVALGDR
jgi:hypothetical protein